MGQITHSQANALLCKLRGFSVKVRLASDGCFEWKDKEGVLCPEQLTYMRSHSDELASALMREEMDSHLPDGLLAALRTKAPSGCFSGDVACRLFDAEELEKLPLSLANKEAKQREKPGHAACGECILHAAEVKLQKAQKEREARERRIYAENSRRVFHDAEE